MVKLVLIPSQLRMDSFLRCGSESSRFGAGIWVFYFLAQRCPDGLSKHTLRSPSQTLGMNGNPKRERERERERAHSVLLLFYFSKVFFLVFKGGKWLSSAELALVVMVAQ